MDILKINFQQYISIINDMFKRLLGFDPTTMKVRTEIIAGATTFLTMSYILAVNPSILSSTGMDKGALFTATAIASAIATLLLAFMAKLPFAQAPSMGLNAFFAYTLCQAMGYSWQQSLAIMLAEGILFVAITFFNVRELILNSIPQNLRFAISAGIGMFIAFIGMENSGIIVNNDATLVSLGDITQGTALLAMVGLFITAGMVMAKVRGGILWGILVTTLLGLFIKDPATGKAITQLNGFVSSPVSVAPIFCKFEWSQLLTPDILVVVFTLLFMDMFDTMGTIIGVHQSTGMANPDAKRDNIPGMEKMFMADSIATVAGACLGTSTTTTYVESASGVGEGGRTGLTAFSTAVCFALALFFSPLFLAIPSAATAPALIIVGVMMMPAVARIHWDNFCKAIPAFLTIVTIPLAYSISDGILIGVISYVLCHAVAGKFNDISITMWILAILFICKYIFL